MVHVQYDYVCAACVYVTDENALHAVFPGIIRIYSYGK